MPLLVRGQNAVAPVAPAAPAPASVSVEAPVTIKIVDADDVSITSDGSATVPATGDVTVKTATVGGPAAAPVHTLGPRNINVTGAGKVTVTAVAPGTISYANGVVTVSAGQPVSVTVDAQGPVKPAALAAGVPEDLELPYFDIMVGTITLNPFQVAPNTPGPGYHLVSGDTQTRLTIQANAAYRWAWDTNSQSAGSTMESMWDHWGNITEYDFQARAGYTYTQGSTNASTIIGSGDFDLEFTAAKQLCREGNLKRNFAYSFNLELSIETVTERQFSDAHSTFFVGPSWVASFGVGVTNRLLLLFRGGLARYELPRLSDGGLNIQSDSSGFPSYHDVLGGAMEMEVHYPVPLVQGYLTAGARVYASHSPVPWTLWLGYSVTGKQLQGILSSL